MYSKVSKGRQLFVHRRRENNVLQHSTLYPQRQIELRVSISKLTKHIAGVNTNPFSPPTRLQTTTWKKGEERRSFREALRIFLTLERSKVRE